MTNTVKRYDHHLAKGRERWHRHARRQAEAGLQRFTVQLSAAELAALDAHVAACGGTRASAVRDAIADWLQRTLAAAAAPEVPPTQPPIAVATLAPVVPAPRPEAPPRRPWQPSPQQVEERAAKVDAANRVPVRVLFPWPVQHAPYAIRTTCQGQGLRGRGTHEMVGRLRPEAAERLAQTVRQAGAVFEVTGKLGEAPYGRPAIDPRGGPPALCH